MLTPEACTVVKTPRVPVRPWNLRASPGWTDAETRGVVLSWLRDFVLGHSWTTEGEAEEDYEGREIQYRVPFGPTNLPNADPFRARDGAPVLRLRVYRWRGLHALECAISFPVSWTLGDVSARLPEFGAAFEASHRLSLAP